MIFESFEFSIIFSSSRSYFNLKGIFSLVLLLFCYCLLLSVYLFTHVSNAVRRKRAHVRMYNNLEALATLRDLIFGGLKNFSYILILAKIEVCSKEGAALRLDSVTTTMQHNKTRWCPYSYTTDSSKCGTKSEWYWTYDSSLKSTQEHLLLKFYWDIYSSYNYRK